MDFFKEVLRKMLGLCVCACVPVCVGVLREEGWLEGHLKVRLPTMESAFACNRKVSRIHAKPRAVIVPWVFASVSQELEREVELSWALGRWEASAPSL